MNTTFTLAQAVQIANQITGDESASLFNGTLYVDCPPQEASEIAAALREASEGEVIMSGTSFEYSFDFA